MDERERSGLARSGQVRSTEDLYSRRQSSHCGTLRRLYILQLDSSWSGEVVVHWCWWNLGMAMVRLLDLSLGPGASELRL